MTISIMSVKKILKGFAVLIFWIALWALCSKLINQVLLLPSPLTVCKRLFVLCKTGSFWEKTAMSLFRIFFGWAIGIAAGVILSAGASASSVFNSLTAPVIHTVRATPVTSFIILVMLWLGYSDVPIFISALLVVPIIYGNMKTGISEADRNLLEVAKIYRFGRVKTLKAVYLPSVRPYLYSGCITSLGLAWKAGIAAEVLCQPKNAIGSEIYYSRYYLETPDLFAWTAVVIILSYVLEKVFSLVFRKGGAQ